jgi:hypothetical protein
LGQLFDVSYDLLLYDVTSTYFEGLARGNSLAQYGYSRDRRSDCKQVCVALVVSRCGLPWGYEVFAGNRHDVTTVEDIVLTMEKRYGRADRVWVMDRGMVSNENIEFLREGARRYIIGTPKGMLRRFERDLIKQDNWRKVYEGLEVKSCPSPDGQETFILCRSEDRRGSRCRWPSKAGVGEGGGMAGLGCSERRLLSVTYQYYRLERRRVVEGVHAVDGC